MIFARTRFFAALFADNANYSPSDSSADYTVVQRYGVTNNISSAPLSPVLSSLGYFVDNQPAQSTISDAKLRGYLVSLLGIHNVVLAVNRSSPNTC